MHPLFGPNLQLGFVVRDIEGEMRRWATQFGIGPFAYMPDIFMPEASYRGAPAAIRLACALAYRGDGVQIELIQPLDDKPSPYADFLASGRDGLHHFGFWPDDQDAAEQHLTSLGLVPVFSVIYGSAPRPSFYYPDPGGLGAMIELIEGGARKQAGYERIKALAHDAQSRDRAWEIIELYRPR